MSLLETENWESGKVYRTDSGDMVRSKQERFVANLLLLQRAFPSNMKGSCLAGMVLSATQTLLSLLTVNSITGNTGGWLMITLTDKTLPRGSDGIVSMATMTT